MVAVWNLPIGDGIFAHLRPTLLEDMCQLLVPIEDDGEYMWRAYVVLKPLPVNYWWTSDDKQRAGYMQFIDRLQDDRLLVNGFSPLVQQDFKQRVSSTCLARSVSNVRLLCNYTNYTSLHAALILYHLTIRHSQRWIGKTTQKISLTEKVVRQLNDISHDIQRNLLNWSLKRSVQQALTNFKVAPKVANSTADEIPLSRRWNFIHEL